MMVRAFGRQSSMQKARSFHFRKVFDIPGKFHGLIFDDDGDEKVFSRTDSSRNIANDPPLDIQPAGPVHSSPPPALAVAVAAAAAGEEAKTENRPSKEPPSDIELIKERFSKLLLGEDMSGAGNGVSSALALSNAITNLAASIFGEISKLEPMTAERKSRWKREIEWLLCVTDHIVEFAPSKQIGKDGSCMEIMTTRQRSDLFMNIPPLRKLDAILINTLDNFKDQDEFWYVSANDDDESQGNNNQRKSEKWWLPRVKLPPEGLSEDARRWMLSQKDSVNQVLKAAMAINAQILSEMEIPENYIDSLPKHGRESLGDSLYKNITEEYFDPGQFLATMDLSTEHKVLDIKNRIEASIVIWQRKMISKDSKSSWSSAVSMEKRELFEERAETVLLIMKKKFPGLPQSSLDISKIQYNKDVGQSILESYSRVIETLAYTVLSRIEDVLHADSLAQNPSLAASSRHSMDSSPIPDDSSGDENHGTEPSCSMTLSDFMGWSAPTPGEIKRNNPAGDLEEESSKEKEDKGMTKSPDHIPRLRGYLDKLEHLKDLKSTMSRH